MNKISSHKLYGEAIHWFFATYYTRITHRRFKKEKWWSKRVRNKLKRNLKYEIDNSSN